VSFFSFPICVGIILISPTFIPLFLGSQFYGSVLPIQILSLILIFIGLNNLFAVQCLVGLGYDKLFLYSILVGTFTNFLLNLILIPNYGAVGASIASSVAEFFVLSASFYMVVKYTPIHLTLKKEFVQTILGVVLMAIEYFFMRPFFDGWILTIVFMILAYTTYALFQYMVRNQTAMTLIDLVTNNFKHNE
ncbi:MAG: polysaccharide biosynthesis C-terminal domain-containing protein, partial [Aeriscardovia sp.]|nr:polysaccharide biosynthesis C-terminal domain-containing protein [Aeriscardovia sp.]